MHRRKFLALAGGGFIGAAGVGAGAFAMTRTPLKALEPWRLATSVTTADPRRAALSFAILAPNPHNMQPWLIDLRQPGLVILRVDHSRLLPETDPLSRQITIGLGCFLELMRMAAAEQGFRVDLDLFPEGESAERLTDAPVAIARFHRDTTVKRDPLFAAALARRSYKRPFDTNRQVSPQNLAALLSVGQGTTNVGGSVTPEDISYWRNVTESALALEVDTPRTFKESVDVFRIGRREIEANPDGIALGGVMIESLALLGQFDRSRAMDRSSSGFKQGRASVLLNTTTAMGHVWMVTKANTRRDQIAAGADWLRINLKATSLGLAFQPLSQPLQEYPEMKAHYDATHRKLAPGGGTVQMLARIGYGPEIPPAPRWSLDAKVMTRPVT